MSNPHTPPQPGSSPRKEERKRRGFLPLMLKTAIAVDFAIVAGGLIWAATGNRPFGVFSALTSREPGNDGHLVSSPYTGSAIHNPGGASGTYSQYGSSRIVDQRPMATAFEISYFLPEQFFFNLSLFGRVGDEIFDPQRSYTLRCGKDKPEVTASRSDGYSLQVVPAQNFTVYVNVTLGNFSANPPLKVKAVDGKPATIANAPPFENFDRYDGLTPAQKKSGQIYTATSAGAQLLEFCDKIGDARYSDDILESDENKKRKVVSNDLRLGDTADIKMSGREISIRGVQITSPYGVKDYDPYQNRITTIRILQNAPNQ